jgi:hypothetical protein
MLALLAPVHGYTPTYDTKLPHKILGRIILVIGHARVHLIDSRRSRRRHSGALRHQLARIIQYTSRKAKKRISDSLGSALPDSNQCTEADLASDAAAKWHAHAKYGASQNESRARQSTNGTR